MGEHVLVDSFLIVDVELKAHCTPWCVLCWPHTCAVHELFDLTSTWTEVGIQIVCVNMTQFSCEHKMSCLLTCMYLLFNERQSICLVLTWHPWCCETAAGTAALDTLRGLTRMMLTFVCVLLPRLFVCYWPRLFVCYFQRHWRVKTRNLGYVVLIIA